MLEQVTFPFYGRDGGLPKGTGRYNGNQLEVDLAKDRSGNPRRIVFDLQQPQKYNRMKPVTSYPLPRETPKAESMP